MSDPAFGPMAAGAALLLRGPFTERGPRTEPITGAGCSPLTSFEVIMRLYLAATVGGLTRHRWKLVLGVVVPAVISTPFAYAQSPAKTVEEFGLFGTWADDCRAEPGPANQYAVFTLNSRGHVELRNDFGPDYDEMIYRIVDAQRLSYYRLGLRQLLTTDDNVALNVVMVKSNDRIRIWSSQGADGSTLVENGSIPSANDQETGWMMRCHVRWTGHGKPRFENRPGLALQSRGNE